MIKLLIGGSPCTYWSIAQKKNRETENREYYILGVVVKNAEW